MSHNSSKINSGSTYNLGQSNKFLITLLTAATIAGLIAGPAIFIQTLTEQPEWSILPIFGFLIALESALTTRWLEKVERTFNRSAYRIAELIVVMGISSGIYWLVSGLPVNPGAIRNYFVSPLSLISLNLLIFIALIFLAWQRSHKITVLFNYLELSQDELIYFGESPSDRAKGSIITPVPVYRDRLLQAYVREWLIGGLFLGLFVVFTSLSKTDLNPAISNMDPRAIDPSGIKPELIVAMLVYFLGGFWLTSIGRMMVMQARWLSGGLEIDNQVLLSWRSRGLLTLLLIAFVAALLPIGDTFALAEIIRGIIGVLFSVATYLFALMVFILLSFLSLFSGDPPENLEFSPDFGQATPPTQPPIPNLVIPTPIIGIIFWMLVIAAALIALYTYFSPRFSPMDTQKFNRFFILIFGWIANLWRQIANLPPAIGSTIRALVSGNSLAQQRLASPWRFVRLRSLPPRERIRYYYLSILHRTAKKGVSRLHNQTPNEFQATFKEVWPESIDDFDQLTESFIHARYTLRPILEPDAASVKKVFERVRSAIRQPLDQEQSEQE